MKSGTGDCCQRSWGTFWKRAFKSTFNDWVRSCERSDPFEKRLMYLGRLDAVVGNMSRVTFELADVTLAAAKEEK